MKWRLSGVVHVRINQVNPIFNSLLVANTYLLVSHAGLRRFTEVMNSDHLSALLKDVISFSQTFFMKLWRKYVRILTRKMHPKIKLQRLRKIRIWTFASLVHQIKSFQEVQKLEQIFQKNKVVTGKTLLFVVGPFCSRHSICLNIGFWQSSFKRKWCVFNLSGFN